MSFITGLTDTQLRATSVSVKFDQATPGTTNAVSIGHIGSTAVASGNGVVGAGVQRVAIASDNSNVPANVAQMNGVAVTMGSGVVGTGVQRVVLATDIGLPTGANVIGALTANQTVDVAKIAGTATATGNGVVSAGVQRVAIASDNSNVPANIAQMNGVAVTMGSGVVGTGVQRVVLATDIGLPTGANVIGALTANQTVDVAKIAGTATATGNGVVSAGVQRVAIASDNTAFSVNATGPTLTKATQGSTGFSVQDLKDAGRNTLAMTAEFTFAQTAETLLTMTLSQNSGATGTFTSRVITSGKRMRLQQIHMQVEGLGSGTAPQRAYLRLRANAAGATTTGSSLQAIVCCGVTTAIVKGSNWVTFDLPDGFELPGDGTATFGFTLETPDWVNTTATGRAKITVVGFEY